MRVTDGQTDGRTDGRTDGQNYNYQDRASIAASRGEKGKGNQDLYSWVCEQLASDCYLKDELFLSWNKSQLQLNEVCYKVSLRENFLRQRCTLIPLSNGTLMLGKILTLQPQM